MSRYKREELRSFSACSSQPLDNTREARYKDIKGDELRSTTAAVFFNDVAKRMESKHL